MNTNRLKEALIKSWSRECVLSYPATARRYEILAKAVKEKI